MDLVIRSATIVDAHCTAQMDVAIHNGKVAALLNPGAPCDAATELDAAGLLLLPGLIDAHVHLREPGLIHKETIHSGTVAAACGGVTTVLDMPNTIPPVATVDALQAKAGMVEGKAQVDVGLFALLAPGMLGRLSEMVDVGCVGFKLFLGPTTGNLQAPNWGELIAGFKELSGLGVPVVVHAEDREAIDYWQAATSPEPDCSYAEFLSTRPASGEIAATERICRLAGETGTPVHIAHVALAEAVAVIAAAKQRGWPVTAETCPPYLFLTADDYAQIGTAMKVLPPVRHAHDQQALWQGLRTGVIDIVATDHAPHTATEKAQPLMQAASGAAGVETLLPLLLSAANSGRCTVNNIVNWCAAIPAQRFGLQGKGRIIPGAWADLVLVNPRLSWKIVPSELHSLAQTTPYAGWQGEGLPVITLLRGKAVMQNGSPVGNPTGHWIRGHASKREH